MRLGLIADIHADLRALERALRGLESHGVEQVVCAGDLVGYGDQPDAVVALVRAQAIPCIRGNHDRWAVERRQVIGSRGWQPAALRDETWEFLHALPASARLDHAGRVVAVHHGSPESDTEFVTPYKPLPASIARFWDEGAADVLVLGHSHIPMIDRGPRGTIVNPGSVAGVPGVQTSYSFAYVDLSDLLVRIFDVRTGREIRRDPMFLEGQDESGGTSTGRGDA
jgi:putative phosphoesterase